MHLCDRQIAWLLYSITIMFVHLAYKGLTDVAYMSEDILT